MNGAKPTELSLTIPLQRHLGIKALPYGEEPDRHFCWDLHVISLRGRSSLLDQIVNAKPSRCVGFEGLGAAAERLAAALRSFL